MIDNYVRHKKRDSVLCTGTMTEFNVCKESFKFWLEGRLDAGSCGRM
jgi:hypothetical protein